MPRCRIYLFTYRRNHLLPRALESVLAQTFRDFVCEVHNDDPEDREPARIVASFGDPRLIVKQHERNLGPIRSYNLAFQRVDEEYVAMLQDDNWWAPGFLEQMIRELDNRPDVSVATANQRIWEEEKNGTWSDTRRTTLPVEDRVYLQYWPSQRQVMGARYADGATVIRGLNIERYTVPERSLFDTVELYRERCFPFPILMVATPLAYFAMTRETARGRKVSEYACAQLMAAGSFFRYFRPSSESLNYFLGREGERKPRRTNTIVLAALLYPGCRYLILRLDLSDWLFFLASVAKRPGRLLRTAVHFWQNREVRNFLNKKTQERAYEAFDAHIDDFVDT